MNPATTPAAVGLTVQVTLVLSGLHPAVTQGGLDCGAIAQSTSWVEAWRTALVDYDSVNQFVLRPAHYVGQESLISFPVAARAYSGSETIRLMLAPQGLLDPATRHPWTPAPAVLVACWLTLNGRPAVWDRGSTAQPVTATNLSGVSPNPLVVAVVDVSGAGPWAATGHLAVQGQYFVPAPISVAVTVQVDGAATAPAVGMVGAPAPTVTATSKPPTAPAGSGSLAGPGSARVPVPISVSGALAAKGSMLIPAPITLSGALSAGGGARLLLPIALSAALTAKGGALFPTPITLSAALAAKGGALIPAPITLNAALTASGSAAPVVVPPTQRSTLPPK